MTTSLSLYFVTLVHLACLFFSVTSFTLLFSLSLFRFVSSSLSFSPHFPRFLPSFPHPFSLLSSPSPLSSAWAAGWPKIRPDHVKQPSVTSRNSRVQTAQYPVHCGQQQLLKYITDMKALTLETVDQDLDGKAKIYDSNNNLPSVLLPTFAGFPSHTPHSSPPPSLLFALRNI